MENTGNHNFSLDASVETTASSMVTGTDQDSQSAIVQGASTSGEGQPPGTDTLMAIDTATAFACPMCPNTSFRQNQIKRLRCSHVFHQSCIDKWLKDNRNCPVCQTPYRSKRAHRQRRHHRNRNPPVPENVDSPDASAGTTASSVVTGTDQDSQSVTVQEASTSGEGQAPSRDTPTEFVCPLCPNRSFRQNQFKRLLCSHVFHQSCIDKWLRKNNSCPLCRVPHGRVRPRRQRRPHGNRMPPVPDNIDIRQIVDNIIPRFQDL
ncbi:hypothetical protein AVEN_128809-1 [Araneus ventricosus]|uniref:RING-type E3 ubiquitin transferase n=1 Tax=Araneus ventricosus TaxID=182803 RepID=A0A4Y2K4X0_ARAVE|nr:hypothetical protein AVEN_128809-1 [Araneus ventricosus]